MEDERLKELFGTFDPGLAPDAQFMATLRQNLATAETIQRHCATVRRHNRTAMAAAAIAGFAAGVAFTLLCPPGTGWPPSISIQLPLRGLAAIDLHTLAGIAAAAVSGFTAYNTYAIAMARLYGRHPHA